ncbi:unnamed protein product [Rhizophagus irregularis]|nr:unnamed protein product [Rhizophagus irregularis]
MSTPITPPDRIYLKLSNMVTDRNRLTVSSKLKAEKKREKKEEKSKEEEIEKRLGNGLEGPQGTSWEHLGDLGE